MLFILRKNCSFPRSNISHSAFVIKCLFNIEKKFINNPLFTITIYFSFIYHIDDICISAVDNPYPSAKRGFSIFGISPLAS